MATVSELTGSEFLRLIQAEIKAYDLQTAIKRKNSEPVTTQGNTRGASMKMSYTATANTATTHTATADTAAGDVTVPDRHDGWRMIYSDPYGSEALQKWEQEQREREQKKEQVALACPELEF